MDNAPAVIATLVPIAGIAFVTIAVWLGERRKEKESFQRCELLRKIADSQGDAAQRVLAVIRQQDYEAQVRRREGLKLGGLITLAAGIGLMIFLYMIEREEPVWVAGSIPILVGAALVGYVFFLSAKPGREGNNL
jgi:hypothetical protein